MPEKLTPERLEQVLRHCVDKNSPEHEAACRYFIATYRRLVYKVVYLQCSSWLDYRSPAGMSETVNDIVSEIFCLLLRDNSNVLRNFSARRSHKALSAYLSTISQRVTKTWLRKKLIQRKAGQLPKSATAESSREMLWQMFDYIVTTLRIKARIKGRLLERNILLFNLYKIEEFSMPMLVVQPMFRTLGERALDNVIQRCLEKFSREDEKTLREFRD